MMSMQSALTRGGTMRTEVVKANKADAAELEVPKRRWVFIFGLYLVTLNLLASAGLFQSSPAAPQGQATATAGQKTKLGIVEDLATIIQSGSTNTAGYKVLIHNDGSATA